MCSPQSQSSFRALCDQADFSAQRDVLLRLLALDPIGAGVSTTELHGDLGGLPLRELACALPLLERSGLVELRDGRVHTSRALRHLHRLELLAF